MPHDIHVLCLISRTVADNYSKKKGYRANRPRSGPICRLLSYALFGLRILRCQCRGFKFGHAGAGRFDHGARVTDTGLVQNESVLR